MYSNNFWYWDVLVSASVFEYVLRLNHLYKQTCATEISMQSKICRLGNQKRPLFIKFFKFNTGFSQYNANLWNATPLWDCLFASYHGTALVLQIFENVVPEKKIFQAFIEILL